MTETPFFSIIVVCYNAGEELHKTIKSILEQTFSSFEIIVKDAGSTDGSTDGLSGDDRIRMFCTPDTGIYDAMNQAASYVEGDYVLFLNCGDYFYDTQVLEKMHRAIVGSEGHSIYYGNIFERKTGNLVQSNPKLDAFGCYRNVPCHQCCFYPKEWIKPGELSVRGREYPFSVQYRVRADYEHFLWCFFAQKVNTVYVPITVCSYEGGGFSETQENRKRSAKEHKQITKQYMSASMRFRYRAVLILTLAPLRTRMAQSRHFSAMYQSLKKRFYRG